MGQTRPLNKTLREDHHGGHGRAMVDGLARIGQVVEPATDLVESGDVHFEGDHLASQFRVRRCHCDLTHFHPLRIMRGLQSNKRQRSEATKTVHD